MKSMTLSEITRTLDGGAIASLQRALRTIATSSGGDARSCRLCLEEVVIVMLPTRKLCFTLSTGAEHVLECAGLDRLEKPLVPPFGPDKADAPPSLPSPGASTTPKEVAGKGNPQTVVRARTQPAPTKPSNAAKR